MKQKGAKMRTIEDALPIEAAIWNHFILFMSTMPEKIMQHLLLLASLSDSLGLKSDELHLHELSNLGDAFDIVLHNLSQTFSGEVIPIPENAIESIQKRAVNSIDSARIFYSNGQHKKAYGELADFVMSLIKMDRL